MADASIKGNRVVIPGLDQLRKDLKKMPKDVQKEFRKNMKAVGEKVVADAKSRVPSTGMSRRYRSQREAAAGIQTRGYNTGPGMVESKNPTYLQWLDFGSRTAVLGNPRSMGPWALSGPGPEGGRFIYPAIRANADQILAATRRTVDDAARKAKFK